MLTKLNGGSTSLVSQTGSWCRAQNALIAGHKRTKSTQPVPYFGSANQTASRPIDGFVLKTHVSPMKSNLENEDTPTSEIDRILNEIRFEATSSLFSAIN